MATSRSWAETAAAAAAAAANNRQPPPQPRGGRGYGERAFVEKIAVEHLFPPGVRPASVLIGVKGSNHARMQSSGCLVQLRGKGCSPDPATNEGPIHLLVKYDTREQLDKLMAILNEIVTECNMTGGRRLVHRPGDPATTAVLGNNSSNNMAGAAGPSSPTSPGTVVPPIQQQLSSSLQSYSNNSWIVNIDNWVLNQREITPQELMAECELLWFFKIYLCKEKTIPIDALTQDVATFFHIMAIDERLAATSLPRGPCQIFDFIRSCPHLFIISYTGSRAMASLVDSVVGFTKEQLCDFHNMVRKSQFEGLRVSSVNSNKIIVPAAAVAVAADPEARLTELMGGNVVGPYGDNASIPLDPTTLMAQALHAYIASRREVTQEELETGFERAAGVPFSPEMFGFESSLHFIKSMPTIFVINSNSSTILIRAAEQPNFKSIYALPPAKVGFQALVSALKAKASAANNDYNNTSDTATAAAIHNNGPSLITMINQPIPTTTTVTAPRLCSILSKLQQQR